MRPDWLRRGRACAQRDRRAAPEVTRQRAPQLGRAPSVLETPYPNAAQCVVVHEVVLQSERDRVIPIQLARAVERRVVPGVPPLLAAGVVRIAMRDIAAGLDLGRARFG